jgi:hypothetical protein
LYISESLMPTKGEYRTIKPLKEQSACCWDSHLDKIIRHQLPAGN